MAFQVFSRARNREAFFVEQALDFENRLNVFAAIEAMAAGTLNRFEHREFRFPVAKDEGFRRRQAADLADAEKALLRDGRRLMTWGSTCHIFGLCRYRRPFSCPVNPCALWILRRRRAERAFWCLAARLNFSW